MAGINLTSGRGDVAIQTSDEATTRAQLVDAQLAHAGWNKSRRSLIEEFVLSAQAPEGACAISSPLGAVSTLIGLFSFVGPALLRIVPPTKSKGWSGIVT